MGARLTRVLRAVVVIGSLVTVLAPLAWAMAAMARRPWTITAYAVVITVAVIVVSGIVRRLTAVRRGTVLEWDLATMPPSVPPANPAQSVTGRKPLTVREAVDALERAAGDKRVTGLLAHIGFGAAAMADVQDLRDAVLAFRAAGKRATAFSDTFGNVSYYLATAFDSIVFQPGGDFGVLGFSRDVNFLRGTLDKAGIGWDGGKRYEYKNANDQLTERKFTKPHRESMARLYDSMHEQLVAGIAEQRRLEEGRVRQLIDGGPLLAHEAVDAGLVDQLGYRDEAVAKAGGTLLFLDKYKKRAGKKPARGGTIALVTATGMIFRHKSEGPPVAPGGPPMDGAAVSAAIRKAAADKKVKAIVLRVDSPGGSAVASETIWREVVRARQQGTPVVASMGRVAASGGYYISCGCDRIVAQPGTITGSIGVVMGKPVLTAAKTKVGMNVEQLKTAANAGILSVNHRFSAAQRERIDATLDDIYESFTTKVADGRDMTVDDVHDVARGRVWSGSDARDRGLVDELGGLPVAVAAAKRLAGIKDGVSVRVRPYPRDDSPLAQLRKRRGDSSEDQRAARELLSALAPLAPIARDMTRDFAAALQAQGALLAPVDERDWLLQ